MNIPVKHTVSHGKKLKNRAKFDEKFLCTVDILIMLGNQNLIECEFSNDVFHVFFTSYFGSFHELNVTLHTFPSSTKKAYSFKNIKIIIF